MATVSGTVAPTLKSVDGSLLSFSWTPMLNGDVGTQAEFGEFADRSVQFTGTFGSGGSASLEGSNDGTNWFILTQPGGTAATKTAAGLVAIVELTQFIRPHVTAGDGTTSLTAIVFARRATPLHQ